MHKFVKNILLFALIIALTLLVGEILIRNSGNPYSYKDAFIRNHGKDISTLILGNSHTYYGVRADMIDSAFNLANVSQNYEYDYRLLEQYLPLLPNLRNVIISLSYFSIREPQFESGDEWWYASNYKMYMHIDKHSDLSRYNFEISYPPIYSGRLKKVIFGGNANCDSFGGCLDNYPEYSYSGWENQAKKRVESNTFPDSASESNIRWLRQICQLCKSHNINIIIVTTPTHISYNSLLNPDQLAQMYGVAKLMSQDYNAVYLNYLTDKRFSYNDFFDSDHLIDPGARRFTSILLNDLSEYIKPDSSSK